MLHCRSSIEHLTFIVPFGFRRKPRKQTDDDSADDDDEPPPGEGDDMSVSSGSGSEVAPKGKVGLR